MSNEFAGGLDHELLILHLPATLGVLQSLARVWNFFSVYNFVRRKMYSDYECMYWHTLKHNLSLNAYMQQCIQQYSYNIIYE